VSAADLAFMRRALFIAQRGRGRASPNPIVGAVVVTPDGVVVGQGAHLKAGEPHAEVHALEEAGARARGATLYCTLEPCAHTGRTPPCAPRVADAGIARAVIAMADPNPLVSGQGLALLESRGVRVDRDVCTQDAARDNAAFLTWIAKGRPHVTLKIARTRDGFVGQTGARIRLTGAAMDRLMHRQRAEVDAIAVGSGTVLADDPLLTPRGAFRERPLTRVVFDWRLRCAVERRLYRTLDAGPVVLFAAAGAVASNRRGADDLRTRGVEVVSMPERDLAGALKVLAGRSITSLLVEGGPALQDAFAAAGLVDRVQTITVPRDLGSGVAEPRLLTLEGRLSAPREMHAGEDVLLEADVHRTD